MAATRGALLYVFFLPFLLTNHASAQVAFPAAAPGTPSIFGPAPSATSPSGPVYNVGGDNGWTLPFDSALVPNVSIGTVLNFTYDYGASAFHNVYQMPNEASWNSCNFGHATLVGFDYTVTVVVSTPGVSYFASGAAQDCTHGLKVKVLSYGTPIAAAPPPYLSGTPPLSGSLVDVGGDAGWSLPFDYNVRVNASVGDVLNFTYNDLTQSFHDVWQMEDLAAWTACDALSASLIDFGTPMFITVQDVPGPIYYASLPGGNNSDCLAGLKVIVDVSGYIPVPPPPPSPLPPPPSGRVINIGGDSGWNLPFDSSVRPVAQPGDTLNFTFDPTVFHDVWQCDSLLAWTTCNVNASTLISFGDPTFIPVGSGSGSLYFASMPGGDNTDCLDGLKVIVDVQSSAPLPAGVPPPPFTPVSGGSKVVNVGGDSGWSIPFFGYSPPIFVGDVLNFTYDATPGTYDVWLLAGAQAFYDCNFTGAWFLSADPSYLVPVRAPGYFFFASSLGPGRQQCNDGLRVALLVQNQGAFGPAAAYPPPAWSPVVGGPAPPSSPPAVTFPASSPASSPAPAGPVVDVGGDSGWTLPFPSSVQLQVRVGDVLNFSYPIDGPFHDVWQLPSAAAYQKCDFSGAQVVGVVPPVLYTVAAPYVPGNVLFFASESSTDCRQGLKVSILIIPGNASAPSATGGPAPAQTPPNFPVSAMPPPQVNNAPPTSIAPAPAPAYTTPSALPTGSAPLSPPTEHGLPSPPHPRRPVTHAPPPMISRKDALSVSCQADASDNTAWWRATKYKCRVYNKAGHAASLIHLRCPEFRPMSTWGLNKDCSLPSSIDPMSSAYFYYTTRYPPTKFSVRFYHLVRPTVVILPSVPGSPLTLKCRATRKLRRDKKHKLVYQYGCTVTNRGHSVLDRIKLKCPGFRPLVLHNLNRDCSIPPVLYPRHSWSFQFQTHQRSPTFGILRYHVVGRG